MSFIRMALFAFACVAAAGPARAKIDWTYERPGTEKTMGDWFRSVLHLEGFGRTYAVIVGVNEFTRFPILDATANDPERIFQFLRDEALFDRILVLRNEEVTLSRLRHLFMTELHEVLKPEDRLLFYWSGHGTQFEDSRGNVLGYLPLVESETDDRSSMVGMEQLKVWDDHVPARHALFLLDACFSGLVGNTAQSLGPDSTIKELSEPGHQIISAGGKDQQTIASRQEWQGSIFTHALLKALRGSADKFGGEQGDGDGVITLYELIESIAGTVEQAKSAADWNRPLRPVLNRFYGEGQFFFLTEARVRDWEDQSTLPIRLSPTPTICSVSPWTAGKGRRRRIE